MFSNLVESKPKSIRRAGGTIFSFTAHYGLLLFMIYTSAGVATAGEAPREEEVNFVEPTPPEVKKQPPPELVAAPLAPKSVPLLVAPIDIPNTIPEIDLTVRPTNPADFERRAFERSEPSGTGTNRAEPDQPFYMDFQLEKPASVAPNSAAPAYPDILRQAGVEGEALVSFVVDTTGRVDLGSFKVIRATHDLFATAVKNALPRMRFLPAELGDRKVRQLVQQPFSFAIVK
jgi:periplasmic protein TonB